MRARALIDGASFGPDALKVVGQAYDLAWAKISHDFAGGPVVLEAARLALATSISQWPVKTVEMLNPQERRA
jgi:hypothetical protein